MSARRVTRRQSARSVCPSCGKNVPRLMKELHTCEVKKPKPAAKRRRPQQRVVAVQPKQSDVASVDSDSDNNDDVCRLCKEGGNLVCCDRCVHSYCRSCIDLGIEVDSDDEDFDLIFQDKIQGDWTCESVRLVCTTRKKKRRHEEEFSDCEADMRRSNTEFCWLGKPCEQQGLNTYYKGFRMDGVEYSLGDIVFLNNDKDADWVVMIDQVYERANNKDAHRWRLDTRWFYHPNELPRKARVPAGPRELFLTNHIGNTPTVSIRAKATVLRCSGGVTGVDSRLTGRIEQEFGLKMRELSQHDPTIAENAFFYHRAFDTFSDKVRALPSHPQSSNEGDSESEFEVETRVRRKRARPVRTQSWLEGPGRRLNVHGTPKPKASAPPAKRFAWAEQQLQLCAEPKKLPCREVEQAEIASLLRSALRHGGMVGGIYISGMPGTGKTATVKQVIRECLAEADEGRTHRRHAPLPKFDVVELNAMKLPHPRVAYSILHSALEGRAAAPARALGLLDRRFRSSRPKRPCVLLLDELDFLVNRKQDVLYQIFDWAARRHAGLIVIGIANTMDLPERVIPRIASRVGLTRILFSPYTRQQLQAIVEERMRGVTLFQVRNGNGGLVSTVVDQEEAVEFCARKVASFSGDVRRAIQICRHAVQICESEFFGKREPTVSTPKARRASSGRAKKRAKTTAALPDKKNCFVEMRHIERAIDSLFKSNFTHCLPLLSLFEKVVLAAFLAELKMHNSMNEVDLAGLVLRVERVCKNKGLHDIPDGRCVVQIVRGLATTGLFTIDPSLTLAPLHTRAGCMQASQSASIGAGSIRLEVPVDDILYAMHEDTTWNQLTAAGSRRCSRPKLPGRWE